MPKKLMCIDKQKLEWQSYEDEPLSGDQVRIRAHHAAAKHGTEMALYKGYSQARGRYDGEYQLFVQEGVRLAYPVSVGNMVVGEVVEVGSDATCLGMGDKVCAFSGFRETVTTSEARCWLMPPGMPWKSAVCLDPAEFAMGAVRDGHIRVGDRVAVFGLGAIGLMVVQLAKLSGAASVIALDPIGERCEIAKELGADLTLDPTQCDAGLEIKKATDKLGADVIIEYSGAAAAMQQALRGIAYGGRVVMGAFPPPYGSGLDLGAEAHLNIPQIIFSRACSQPDREYPRWNEARIFAECWRLLSEGRITGEPIVQPVVAFDDLADEYPHIASDPQHYLKLGAQL